MKKHFCILLLLALTLPAFAQFKGTNGVAFHYVGSLSNVDVFVVGRPGVTNYNVAASNLLNYIQSVAVNANVQTKTNGANYGTAFRSVGTGLLSEQFGNGAIAIPAGSIAFGSATWIRDNATSGIAIGNSAEVKTNAVRGIAIGGSAIVSDGHTNSVAIGYNALTTAADQIRLGKSTHDVNIPGTLTVAGVITGDGSGLSNLPTGSGSDEWTNTIPIVHHLYTTNITTGGGGNEAVGITATSGNVFWSLIGDVLTLHADAGGVRISGTTTNTGSLRVEGDFEVEGTSTVPTINSAQATITNLSLVNPFNMRLGTNVNPDNLVQYTNGPNPVLVDMSKRAGFVSTNAAFTITGLSLPNTTNTWETSVIYTNTSGSTKTVTLPAAWIGTSTAEYITNQSVLTVWFYPGAGTNALWRALK